METAKLFWSGRSQAVRLPRAFRVDGREVRIRRRGRAIVLEPLPDSWAWLDAVAGELDEDCVFAVRERPGATERPGLTPVFGTSAPPSGVSGLIRKGAYRFSENDLRRWLMLLFADRVNVVEGIIDDLAHGHVPNLFTEMGGPAEWRYNRKGFIRKAVIAGAVLGVVLYLNERRRRR